MIEPVTWTVTLSLEEKTAVQCALADYSERHTGTNNHFLATIVTAGDVVRDRLKTFSDQSWAEVDAARAPF
jgi:hypothetical protein